MKRSLIKIFSCGVLIIAPLLAVAADEEAKQNSRLEGTWKWTFTMPDGGVVTPEVKFKGKDDAVTGTTRFRLGLEAPLNKIKLQGDELSFEVIREHDGLRVVTLYRGTVQGETIKGKIATKSSGAEKSYDWEARKVSSVDGTWKFVNNQPRPFEQKLTLKADGEKLTGKINGGFVRGRGGAPGAPAADIEIRNGEFRDEVVSFEIERTARDGQKTTNYFHGKFLGDRIAGKMGADSDDTTHTNDWNAFRAQ